MSFTADIDRFIAKSEAKLEAVVKTAVQSTIEDAQTLETKGGNMRFKTGFLANSGMAAIGSMPSGDSINTGVQLSNWNIGSTAAILLQWDLKSPFYFGWVANYAKHRENRDGFMRLAAQNWQAHVTQAANRLK
tara:strand:- start:2774 stop:3172 length:399 start_codon:yes stop_codon:yes gene_type:complete